MGPPATSRMTPGVPWDSAVSGVKPSVPMVPPCGLIWRREAWRGTSVLLRNISFDLAAENLLAKGLCVGNLVLDLSIELAEQEDIFMCRLFIFTDRSRIGQWAEAERTGRRLDPMGRSWSRHAGSTRGC